MRRALLLPLLLAPLVACGGGDDEEPAAVSATAAAPSSSISPSAERVAYAAAAEGVCTRAVAAGRAVPRPTTPEQYVTSFRLALRVGEEGLAGLRALTPPTEDAPQLEEGFLGPVGKQVKGFREALPAVEAAAAAPDPRQALAAIADPGAAVTVDLELIERYGMPTCAVFAGKRP